MNMRELRALVADRRALPDHLPVVVRVDAAAVTVYADGVREPLPDVAALVPEPIPACGLAAVIELR